MQSKLIVVKLGGSLIGHAKEVMRVLSKHSVLIVPGGAVFANAVREAYRVHDLSESAAHRMAILAMQQYGLLLADISGLRVCEDLNKIRAPCVFLPYKMLSRHDPFEPSWRVTSDSIACYVAKKLDAELILLKDVDGIYLSGKLARQISARELLKLGQTCVDEELPKLLLKWRMNCCIANGKKLNALQSVLRGNACGTTIVGKK